MATFNEDTRIHGTLTANSVVSQSATITNAMISPTAAIARSKLAQDTLALFSILLHMLRVHDALQTLLPTTAAADDLALDPGVFGTSSPHVSAGDLKAAGATTRYARLLVPLPVEYDDGQTVQIRLHAGMLTTVADTSCTVDVECYKSDEEGGVGSDLCTTAAQSMNSLTFADLDFTITETGLVSGDVLDIRIAVACNDAATGTAVEPVIGAAHLLCDFRG